MVIFIAKGDQSSFSYVYGIGNDDPEDNSDMGACYTTSIVTNASGTKTMTATRPLECPAGLTDPAGNSYIVQLDKELSLCSGWSNKSGKL